MFLDKGSHALAQHPFGKTSDTVAQQLFLIRVVHQHCKAPRSLVAQILGFPNFISVARATGSRQFSENRRLASKSIISASAMMKREKNCFVAETAGRGSAARRLANVRAVSSAVPSNATWSATPTATASSPDSVSRPKQRLRARTNPTRATSDLIPQGVSQPIGTSGRFQRE